MNPIQYEKIVCKIFQKKGYKTKLTPPSHDCGVDIFASKGKTKIAVQVKMYGKSRKINGKTVLELYGAKDYFKCNKAVIVTDGVLMDDAKEIARKLQIEIINHPAVMSSSEKGSEYNVKINKCRFEFIWENHIKKLEGKILTRENGDTNKIVSVNWGGITRITSNGKEQKIPIEEFKNAINTIIEKGEITRNYINQKYTGRASSGIILILAHVPIFKFIKNPSRIILDLHKCVKR